MLINPNTATRLIVDHIDLWQMGFLNPDRLYSFIKDRSVQFWSEHITKLWQLGWLRADVIVSQQGIQMEGVNIIKNERNENFYYSDDRQLGVPQPNIETTLRSLTILPPGIFLYFHPFRYYVLYQIQRVIRINHHPFQIFIQSQYHRMLDNEIGQFNKWTAGDELTLLIDQWNSEATLAIAIEPIYFTEIFGTLRHSPGISSEQQMENIISYRTELCEYIMQIGIDPIKNIISGFCTNAEMLEPNKIIHTLLRFMGGRERLEVKGDLGGALLLKSMAEIVRRMAEFVLKEKLPEEDEMGFGLTVPGIKEKNYGTSRIFDAQSIEAKRQIIRGMGFVYDVRIRFYVEGHTEYYALSKLLSNIPQIEIINLAGQVQQRGGKGIAFRDNLLLDDRAQVFSIILLDGDKDDNIRVVRTAAREDIFCGRFYISKPDFEFGNFTKAELEEIIWSFIDPSEQTDENKNTLHTAVEDSINGKGILADVRRLLPSLSHLGKDKEWGEKLAEFGRSHPEFPGKRIRRPFFEAAYSAIMSIDANFLFTRSSYCTDPETGMLVKRK